MTDSPTIITDTREQTPLVFEHLPSEHLPSERGSLQSGDYSILGLEHDFAIERKSIPDLCQVCHPRPGEIRAGASSTPWFQFFRSPDRRITA